ncbi:beta-galactosidase [Rathayibacter sp. PhB151]|nr:beta-galactosidase [Rathayibacter sp. PhB151]
MKAVHKWHLAEEAYWEDPRPGEGRRRPRADVLSDAPRLRLDGDWRFRLAPTARGTGPGFADPLLDDADWDLLRIPSHWVLEGHGDPLYTNTAFPFPLDPPHLPEENPTGDHRLRFELPAGWPEGGRTVLRFQGVDSCGAAWLNDEPLGWSTGSRLPFEFDVTTPLRRGENLLAVRVQRWSAGSYLEDQDMWWLPGIFREVELLWRPDGAADDVLVSADYEDGTGTLLVRALDEAGGELPGVVRLPELGLEAPAGESVRLPVEPWSAESPRLYRGTLEVAGERIELAVGFRTVRIRDGVFTVNGSPVRLRGVNRHEHDPDRGRALDEATMRRDIELMKRANVTAVRTSHYPPHPAFLRLCDELGLWVLEECDIETHGFIYAGWQGNPPTEPQWREALVDRVTRMVARDRSHPSIVIWSLANESMVGESFDVLERVVRRLDPSRPIHYERDPSFRNSDFSSAMYPALEELAAIAERREPTPEGVVAGSPDDARRRRLPFVLCEYGHAMGNGPGSLDEYQRILESSDRMAGGFVWEWIDHGFRATAADGSEHFRHGGDIDFQPNGGSYCIDGLLFPDRTPSPGLASLARAIAPVVIDVAEGAIAIRSRQDVVDTAALRWRWRVEDDGALLAEGLLDVPAVPARGSVVVPFTAPVAGVLTVSAELAEAAPWAPAGHEVAWGQRIDAPTPAVRRRSARVADEDGVLRLGDALLDPRTGRILSLGGVPVDGPLVDLWRAPTENDRGQGTLNALAASWSAVGLDRVLHRTVSVERDEHSVTVTTRSGPATQTLAVLSRLVWTAEEGAMHLAAQFAFTGAWQDTPHGHHSVTPPRLGLRLTLPGGYADADWLGRGPGESYADTLDAVRFGRFAASIDALQTPYVVPQENGNHVGTRRLSLSGPGLPPLVVTGDGFDFTARRWTSEALAVAAHPHELRDSGHVVLDLDVRQQGVGSASCGPALPERYRVPLEDASLELTFRLG